MVPTNNPGKDKRVRSLLSQGTGAVLMAALFAFGACSSAEPAPIGGSGGSTNSGGGGSSSSGGRTGSGGTPASGSGGSSASTGGTTGSGSGGSTPATGGTTGSGGMTATGGTTGAGGMVGAGGGGGSTPPADAAAEVPPAVGSSMPCNTAPSDTVPTLRRGPAITGFPGMLTAGQIIGVPGEAGTIYVIGHRNGAVYTVQNNMVVPTPLVTVSVANGGNNEQGLLSMAFHPQFATNKLFYLFYTAAGGGAMTIDEFERMTPTTAVRKQNIYSRPRDGGGAFHNGGSITFNPKDTMPYMYFAVGNNEGNGAGNPTGFAGRVLRIDVTSKMATTYAYGLRNPYRMSIDRLTGDMYIADVANGPGGTIIFNAAGMMGRDFGYRNNNGSPDVNNGILRDGAGAAIIGGYVYRGNKIPGLCGRYFYGNYQGGAVKSIVVQNGQRVGNAVSHGTLSVPGNIASFGEDSEGELWMASMNNTIYKIEAAAPAQ
jgi:hypothetical protein